MTHKEYADGLRQIAKWYQAHPEVELPSPVLANYCVNTKEVAATVMRALGSCKKNYADTLFEISKQFGSVTATFVFNRDDVCVRRVVGTREIPEQKIEAHTIPASTVEIVEWDCQPILAPEKGQEAA